MINWYYQDDIVKFANMDCIQGMAELPNNTADLVVTSPPYNIQKSYELGVSFGEYLKLLADMYEQSFHCIKPGGYFVVNFADYYIKFSGENAQVIPMNYLHHILAEHAGWLHQCTRIWQKSFATLTDMWSINSTQPKQEMEWLLTMRKPGGGKERVREQKYHPHSIWSTEGKRNTDNKSTLKMHTAAFPEHLVKMVLDVYSDEGDTVIDPFLGSGTVLFVAKKMGRQGIGFEILESNCQICKNRLSQSVFNWDDANNNNINEVPEDF